jgi:hypothetical protein
MPNYLLKLQFVNIYISFYAANLIDNALQPGDLILTGTPSGVGPVVAGDIITGRLYLGLKNSKIISELKLLVSLTITF